MYWIAMAVFGGILILTPGARREQVPPGTPWFLVIFYKEAMWLYKRISTYFPAIFSSMRVETDLRQLYPEEPCEALKTEYYVKKLALCLGLTAAGTLLGVLAHLAAGAQIVLREGKEIPRGTFEQGVMDITVAADFQGQEIKVRVPVSSQSLSREEKEEAGERLAAMLPTLILGKNESLDNVTADLSLRDSYEGYPFTVRWSSSVPWVISDSGDVSAVEQPTRVTLSARLTEEEYQKTAEVEVTVRPLELTAEEESRRKLEQLVLAAEKESREQEKFLLPETWQGESLFWKQIIKDDSLLLWLMAVTAAAAVYFLSDRDLHSKLEQRKSALKHAYPEIVHKLVLFVGAGMTVRGALQKMAGDYRAGCRKGGGEGDEKRDGKRDGKRENRKQPAYEELLYTCRELRSGVSEGAAYEHFGRRTGMQEYIRLTTLLTQNLKRGNSSLLERLREEADKVSEERLQRIRKLGEEAGTSLLVPMVMMLGVVMVIIMIPAFMTM